MYPGHVVILEGELEWPLQSPDLSKCYQLDFREVISNKVFKHCPHSLLRDRVVEENEVRKRPQRNIDTDNCHLGYIFVLT